MRSLLLDTNSAAEQIPDRAEKILGQLRDTQILQIKRDYVSRLPTWPFDTPILGKFAAIALSVAAILISKIISLPFRIETSRAILPRLRPIPARDNSHYSLL